MIMKRLSWLAAYVAIVYLFAQDRPTPAFEMYQGYYGIATMKAKECTVVSLNPFKLNVR